MLSPAALVYNTTLVAHKPLFATPLSGVQRWNLGTKSLILLILCCIMFHASKYVLVYETLRHYDLWDQRLVWRCPLSMEKPEGKHALWHPRSSHFMEHSGIRWKGLVRWKIRKKGSVKHGDWKISLHVSAQPRDLAFDHQETGAKTVSFGVHQESQFFKNYSLWLLNWN